jgi:hypothetical protein
MCGATHLIEVNISASKRASLVASVFKDVFQEVNCNKP